MRKIQAYRTGNNASIRFRTPRSKLTKKTDSDSLDKTSRTIELLNLKLNLLIKFFAIFFISILLTAIIIAIFQQINSEEIVVEPLKIFQATDSASITSEVITNQLFEKALSIQLSTKSISAARSASFGDPIISKIEMSGVSLSIDEVMKFLRRKAGKNLIIGGYLQQNGNGFAIQLRMKGIPISGEIAYFKDLDGAVTDAAERIVAVTQPIRYADYMIKSRRVSDGLQMIIQLEQYEATDDFAQLAISKSNLLHASGELLESIKVIESELIRTPANAQLQLTLAHRAYFAGQSGKVLKNTEQAIKLWKMSTVRSLSEKGFDAEKFWAKQMVERTKENFSSSAETGLQYVENEPRIYEKIDSSWDVVVDYIRADKIQLALIFANDLPYSIGSEADGSIHYFEGPAEANMHLAIKHGNWGKALENAKISDKIHLCAEPERKYQRIVMHTPWVALATAHTGDIVEAKRLIEMTPPDCYLCVVFHAEILALASDAGGAAYLYDSAIRLAPDIPLAYEKRGEFRLTQAQTLAAIDDFQQAIKRSQDWSAPYTSLINAYKLSGNTKKSLEYAKAKEKMQRQTGNSFTDKHEVDSQYFPIKYKENGLLDADTDSKDCFFSR